MERWYFSQLKLARLIHKIFVNTDVIQCSTLGWLSCAVSGWPLGQFGPTLHYFHGLLFYSTLEEGCMMPFFYLILLFSRVLNNPAEQTSMSPLTEKSLSCDSPRYSNERITGRDAVLCKYCSRYHQYFACSLLHQNCFTKRRNVDLDFHF